jgi:hypothetical protein
MHPPSCHDTIVKPHNTKAVRFLATNDSQCTQCNHAIQRRQCTTHTSSRRTTCRTHTMYSASRDATSTLHYTHRVQWLHLYATTDRIVVCSPPSPPRLNPALARRRHYPEKAPEPLPLSPFFRCGWGDNELVAGVAQPSADSVRWFVSWYVDGCMSVKSVCRCVDLVCMGGWALVAWW